MPSRSPRSVGDLGALARRRAAVGPDADALARRPFASWSQDALGAGEAAFGAAALADRPGRPASTGSSSRRCRGRRGRARLPAAACRARPGRSASRSSASSSAARSSASSAGDGDLEAVLAGVAGAGDHSSRHAADAELAAAHEARCFARPGTSVAHHLAGARSLQRQQRAVAVAELQADAGAAGARDARNPRPCAPALTTRNRCRHRADAGASTMRSSRMPPSSLSEQRVALLAGREA